jgi:hypothetical protein
MSKLRMDEPAVDLIVMPARQVPICNAIDRTVTNVLQPYTTEGDHASP